MNEEQEKQKIRESISTWMSATTVGDIDAILDLMHDDVVFLVAGNAPMRGKAAFTETFKSFAGKIKIDAHSDIQEIEIMGDYTYCWNHLVITITPQPEGAAMHRVGYTLSVFKKNT